MSHRGFWKAMTKPFVMFGTRKCTLILILPWRSPGWRGCGFFLAKFFSPPKTNGWFTWKWGFPWNLGDSGLGNHHFQVPAVNFWGCTWCAFLVRVATQRPLKNWQKKNNHLMIGQTKSHKKTLQMASSMRYILEKTFIQYFFDMYTQI